MKIPNDNHDLSVTELSYLNSIDDSFVAAARIMECSDLDWEGDEEQSQDEYEARHHCGTCQVRAVMETVWPPIQAYIDWLKAGNAEPE